MERYSRTGRAVMGGIFGAGLAALTGSTPVGIAIVAVLGAGLAVKAGRRKDPEGTDWNA